mgnify:CR=1 FL=1
MVERIASAPRSFNEDLQLFAHRFLSDIVGKPRRPQCAVDVLFIGIGAAAGNQAVYPSESSDILEKMKMLS